MCEKRVELEKVSFWSEKKVPYLLFFLSLLLVIGAMIFELFRHYAVPALLSNPDVFGKRAFSGSVLIQTGFFTLLLSMMWTFAVEFRNTANSLRKEKVFSRFCFMGGITLMLAAKLLGYIGSIYVAGAFVAFLLFAAIWCVWVEIKTGLLTI